MSANHTQCVQQEVDSISDAVQVLSRVEDGKIVLVLIPSHRSPFSGTGWWLTIPTGCHCLMQRFGKDVGEALPGGQFKPPWYRIAYIVTQQSCTYNAPVKECPTNDNVRVSVDVQILFMIRDASDFVYKLGAVHFDQLLDGAVDEGIRLLVRSQSHREVRKLRGSRADQLLTHLRNKFEESGVSFTSCTITAVVLPPSLEKSLENTTQLEITQKRVVRGQKYELEQIQNSADVAMDELKRMNEQTIVQENGRKRRAELAHEQKVVKAAEETSKAMIESEQAIQVAKMNKIAELERTKTDMERLRVETLSKAEADAEARRVQADIQYEKALMNAEAEKQRYLGEAQAVRLDAEAMAKASQHMQHRWKHELDMREKEVLKKLAQKANYTLLGEHGDRLVGGLMAGSVPKEAGGGGGWFK